MDARLTFRERTPDICWQKSLRDKFNAEGIPNIRDLSLSLAIVREVSRKFAQQIIFKYEWLGTMAQSKYHFGIFFGPYCAGVTCVGDNCTGNTSASKTWNLRDSRELLILARGACVHWAPKGANSKLVSMTVRLLRAAKRGKLLVAYADSDAGEIGTIYQACNWVYTGRSSAATYQWVNPLGRVYHTKKPSDLKRDRGGDTKLWSETLLKAGWTKQPTNPKHRYVCVIDKTDKALIELVESRRHPYPKRAGSDTADTSANHAEKGGSLPTPALPSLNGE